MAVTTGIIESEEKATWLVEGLHPRHFIQVVILVA